MTECQEVAAYMLRAYLDWLVTERKGNGKANARYYVQQRCPDESMTWTDNVAYALIKQAKTS